MLDKGSLAFVAEGFDRGQAQLGGEFSQSASRTDSSCGELRAQAQEWFEGANGMTAQDVPDGDAEFARDGIYVARFPSAPLPVHSIRAVADLVSR